jgi:hypothetical protein
MYTVRRRYARVLTSYRILSKQEADEQDITHTPWRQAHPGHWALTDDGFVAQCLRLEEFKEKTGRTRHLFTFPFGRIWDSPKAVLAFMERFEVGNWSATSPRSWIEIECRRTRTKEAISLYVRQILATGRPDYEALGKIYRPDQRIPAATFRRLLHQRRIKEMVEKEKTDLISNNGLSLSDILRNYRQLISSDEKKGDLKTIRLVLETMLDLHDILPRNRSRNRS